jgi:hypothetical protein
MDCLLTITAAVTYNQIRNNSYSYYAWHPEFGADAAGRVYDGGKADNIREATEEEPLKKPAQWAETLFDTAYLLFTAGACVYFFIRTYGNALRILYGCMAALLVLGDSCHLIPRVMSFAFPESSAIARARALGKCVASITMTLFYVVLVYVLMGYYGMKTTPALIISVWALAVSRIVLCLFPLRQWTLLGKGAFPILRNIPFMLLGILAAVISLQKKAGDAYPFSFMWLAILMSFTFYLPVALFADKHPRLGMLMLPKTAMYIWMICMGLQL